MLINLNDSPYEDLINLNDSPIDLNDSSIDLNDRCNEILSEDEFMEDGSMNDKCMEDSSKDFTVADYESMLSDAVVYSEQEAYNLYRRYANAKGFSVRKGKQNKRQDGTISMKYYFCYKNGLKDTKAKAHAAYSKMDIRCDCKALIKFSVSKNGVWTVSKLVTEHNHSMCHVSNRHRLRSQREVRDDQLVVLKNMKDAGVRVCDAINVMSKEAGGLKNLGFTKRDAYNELASVKRKCFDGTDSNTLVEIFRKRKMDEEDFYFDFELDDEGRLCSLFWRDYQMRKDYDIFGDLLVHDTTYRTNKYNMICAPFVGMNQNCQNVMFSCGFILNERTESFIWLFKTFLYSMGGRQPVTVMTDQSAAMSAAIIQVFPLSRHRLCVWHIDENSKRNVQYLRNKKGFVEMFEHLLKGCESEAEFNYYWDRFVLKYNCNDNGWIRKLYDVRKKWCPAFSKDYFSGGILSSQRSETTNKSVSKRLRKTAGLCDFYHNFFQVTKGWRDEESAENFACWQGLPDVAIPDVKMLLQMREIYTREIYNIFEHEFLLGNAYSHKEISDEGVMIRYEIWRSGLDHIRHVVEFSKDGPQVSCTCKKFFEVGILCCHCLRILNINCVEILPERYILGRWKRELCNLRTFGDPTDGPSQVSYVGATCSLWKKTMMHKFNEFASFCESSSNYRKLCEEGFKRMTNSIMNENGATPQHNIILNPPGSRPLGERNNRLKSTREKKGNKLKARKRTSEAAKRKAKVTAQNLVQEMCTNLSDVYLSHPTNGSPSLNINLS